MLLLEDVLQVRRLLDETDLSRRAIAKMTGVSRGSVNAIANGDRGLVGAEPCDEIERSTVAERCPGCGGMVYTPCLLCELRASRNGERSRPRGPQARAA